jgi:hypothetical protein
MASKLIAISGGLDSIFILWKMLLSNEDKVTALWMDERYLIEERNGHLGQSFFTCYEEQAVDNCVSWLKSNIRDFDYVKVKNYCYQKTDIMQTWILKYAIENFVKNKQGKMLGLVDNIIFGYHGNRSPYEYMLKAKKKTLEEAGLDESILEFPLMDIYYKDRLDEAPFPIRQIAELPTELFNMTISCQFGHVDKEGCYIPCGKCYKCWNRSYIKEQFELNTANNVIASSMAASDEMANETLRWNSMWENRFAEVVKWLS